MKIDRNPEQSQESLETFYEYLGHYTDTESGVTSYLPHYATCGAMMLRLLNVLTTSPDDLYLLGTTAHTNLVLTTQRSTPEFKRLSISAWANDYEIAFPSASDETGRNNPDLIKHTSDVHQVKAWILQYFYSP